jgi:protein KRI1
MRDEVMLREEEYKGFLQREVGEDLSELVWVEEATVKVDDKDQNHGASSSTNGASKAEGKKKGKRKERKEETDQEFLMK